jgi:hypothetical protein
MELFSTGLIAGLLFSGATPSDCFASAFSSAAAGFCSAAFGLQSAATDGQMTSGCPI